MKQTTKQQPLMQPPGMNAAEQARIKAFVGFSEDDAHALRELLPLITENADHIVGRFATSIQHYPELMELINQAGSSIEQLSGAQKQYILKLFGGDYGESYFEHQMEIGAVHARIGLTPSWYLGSCSVYLQAIAPLITRKYPFSAAKRDRALSALYKIIAIDSELAIDAYNRKTWVEQVVSYKGQIEAIGKSQAMIELNSDGTIITANTNFLGTMGYTLDEVRGKHHSMLVEPAYAQSAEYRDLWDKLGHGKFDAGQYKHIGKGGKELWLQSTFSPVPASDGQVSKIIGLMADVTAEKLELDEVRAELKVRSDIMDVTSIVSESNLKGEITKINHKYEEVSKYSHDELIGQPHSITRHLDMPKETFKAMWSTIGRGGIFRGVIKNRAKDGTPYYVDAVIAPLMGKNGKPRKYLGVRYDITEAEIERQNMKGLLDAINKSFATIELDTKGNILTANDSFLGMMGYTLDEIKGKSHSMFAESAYAQSPEYRLFWEKLNRGEYDAGEYKRIGRGGKEIWVQASYNPIMDEMGRVFKVVEYATDITLQRQQNAEYKEQVNNFSTVIEAVAHGDLRHRVDAKGNDELNTLGSNLNSMVESLAAMSSQISEASNATFGTLSELQAAVNAQSAGASEQAAAVNETTATLEEIKATSTMTLAKTQQLGEVAERTRHEGEQGLQTVGQAISGIEAIRERMENIAQTILALSEQTQQIGEITSVVTNLAQQSKMLALNASIEAAKAGEAGKGFAVVASEVKELAEQSQQSTAQVQKILQDIRHATDRAVMATEEGSKGVDAGVVLVQKSGEVMKQLSEVIRETELASQQIVAAVRQEVTGIEQTTNAMSEINKVTAQFVTSTQQTKVAAADLAQVAEKLKNSVGVYQI